MSAFLCFPVTAYLIVQNIEKVPTAWEGWLFVLLSSLFGLCFNWLVNYGVSVTFPLFIAIGYTLHVPANAIVDRIVRQVSYLFIFYQEPYITVHLREIQLLKYTRKIFPKK